MAEKNCTLKKSSAEDGVWLFAGPPHRLAGFRTCGRFIGRRSRDVASSTALEYSLINFPLVLCATNAFLVQSTASNIPQIVTALPCKLLLRPSSCRRISCQRIRPSTVLPFWRWSRRPLARGAVTPFEESNPSNAAKITSYWVSTDLIAGVRTVHQVAHNGLIVVNETFSVMAICLKIVLNFPDWPNKHPRSWIHWRASRTTGVDKQAFCVTRFTQ